MRLPRFVKPPVFPDEELTHSARMLHFVVWSLLLVIDTQSCAAFIVLPNLWPRWLSILLTYNTILPLLLLLNRRGRPRLAGGLLLVTLWMLMSVLALTAGGMHAPAMWGFIVTVLTAGLLFGGRGGIIAGIIFSLTALFFVLLEQSGHLPQNRASPTTLSLWVNFTMIIELIAVFQYLATHSIKAALKKAKEELAHRRKTELALSESEQRYREVFECTSDLIGMLDVTADGRFLFNRWNPAWDKISEVPAADAAGKEPWEVFPRDLAAMIVSDCRRCLMQKSLISHDRTLDYRGKTHHVHSTLIPVKNNAGRISRIVCVAHNVTEQKLAQDALRRSHEQLEMRVEERTAELQKLNKELEAFSYSVSHDLRRPLRTVAGFTDLLMEDHSRELTEDARELLGSIKAGALQMNQLIEALLCLSRVERQPLHSLPLNPADLARQAMKDLHPEQSGRKVDLRIDGMPACMGDPNLLRQVFVNLLSNALKFTAHCPVAVIEVGSREMEGKTVYFVRDNGAGFDMQYADKLFGVFQRLHSADEFGGTGVGLSIVQRVIHRHGGSIWAEAAVDKGATFYFTLPTMEHNAANEPTRAA